MNFPEQQLDRIKQFSISQDYMVLFLGLWAVAFLGYLLYTRSTTTEDKADYRGSIVNLTPDKVQLMVL